MGTSVSTEGTAPAAGMVSNTMVAGVELGDPVLAENVRDGLAAVETLMVEELSDGEDFLTEAALHLAKAGGKRFRPLFAVLTGQLGPKPNDPSIVTAATVVELVHLATLYHDDVMDEATVRRGAPSANVRWGNSVAILAGDYLFAHASRLTSTLGPSAVEVIAKTFAELVTGQMRETIGASEKKDPIEHYLRVVWEKTGSLIAASGRFGGTFSGAGNDQIERLERLGDAVGVAFQIVDDIIDIASDTTDSGKTPGTDLREGVHTLPVLYALKGEGPDATASANSSSVLSKTRSWSQKLSNCSNGRRAWTPPRRPCRPTSIKRTPSWRRCRRALPTRHSDAWSISLSLASGRHREPPDLLVR